MNSSDYLAFFRPGEGAQAPLLFRSIGIARAQSQIKSAMLNLMGTIEDSINQIEAFVANPPVGNAAHFGKGNLRGLVTALTTVLDHRADLFAEREDSLTQYRGALAAISASAAGDGALNAGVNDA